MLTRILTVTPLALATMLYSSGLEAQILRRGASASPALWVSGAIGYSVPGTINDGRTQATWDFGSSAQYRAAIEIPVSASGYTLGVVGTWEDMPMRYFSRNPAIDPTGSGVDAHAGIWSALGVFRVASNRGFHQVIEISGGVIGYQNFRADGGSVTLPPPGSSTDFTVGIGYGFGYSLSPHSEISLVQEYAWAFHSRDQLPGNTSGTSRRTNLRLGLRLGLGKKGLVF